MQHFVVDRFETASSNCTNNHPNHMHCTYTRGQLWINDRNSIFVPSKPIFRHLLRRFFLSFLPDNKTQTRYFHLPFVLYSTYSTLFIVRKRFNGQVIVTGRKAEKNYGTSFKHNDNIYIVQQYSRG